MTKRAIDARCEHGGATAMTVEHERLLRADAAGEIAWSTLRERGFDSFRDVLTGLGELGLRPPVAPMEGPNTERRERGRAALREALARQDLEPVHGEGNLIIGAPNP